MLDKGMSERAAIIETDIPMRLDRLPWTGFHTLVVAALGITWILDGLEVTLAGSIAGALQESPVLHFSAAEVGAVGSAYLAGAVAGALAVRLPDRPVWPAQTVLCHLGRLLDRHRGNRIFLGFRELCAVPVCDRRRHRRRVRRDQLGDPGIGAGAVSRPHRSRDQRQLLARRRTWRSRCGDLSAAGLAAARFGVARRVRDRCCTRARRVAAAAAYSGKPALADVARPPAGSRKGHRRHRTPGRRTRRPRRGRGGEGPSASWPRRAPRSRG